MNSSASSWMKRWQPLFVSTWRVLGSLLLAYAFIVVLMTAAAQSQVASRLSDLQPKLAYSSGYALLLAHEATARKTAKVREDARQLVEQRTSLQRKRAELFESYKVRYAPIPLLAEICNISNGPDEDIAPIVAALKLCVVNPNLPTQMRPRLEKFLESAPALEKSVVDWQDSNRAVQDKEFKLELVQAQITSFRPVPKYNIDVRAAFNEIDILRNRPYLGGDVLVGVPPSITQILLSFFSGMFGGLLLTLVLIVYPKTNLNLSSPESSYGARILLGGLIAVGVFIVLGGGTAVLGTASAFAEGKANFMAFSAVCVLAGMFSDRVAHWLSQRADTFFATDKNNEPTSPPANS